MDKRVGAELGGGTGVPLGELVGESDARTVGGLRARHGDSFLVFAGRVEELQKPSRPWQATLVGETRSAGESPGFTFRSALVWCVRHTERTLSPRFVSVGRLANTNDVVIADRSISACHAVFEPVATGGYLVRDMGSRNGTFVNGRAVTKGQTMAIRPGDVVRLGSVNLMFLDAEKLTDLLNAAYRIK
jgi:hypothetical protein